MSLFGGSGDGGAAAQMAAQQAQVRQSQAEINKDFAGFTPDFYNKAATDYTQSVTPGMFKDFQNTKNNLTYALARAGILNSGSAVTRNASLTNQLAQNESQIAGNAQQQSNNVQASVNTQKGQLLQQAQAGTDPSVINAQATGAVSQLRAPSAIQPLGNLFADWSNTYLANQNAQAFQSPGTMSIWNQLGNQGVGTVGGNAGSSWFVQ
ncbi:MAG: hypothetical protein KGL39_15605 [Patescibacteria group bacterium]|nr:hypothetical protein [Patescibacteria group bacterium]